MNEITRIHLAKTPYNIEVAAYGALRAYLEAIEKALHADVDAMREIESRMTELLTDRGVSGENVITIADVEALQKQLGDPKDFAGEEASNETQSASNPKKKLMRDTSNAMLGGVCSGIAAYFGWDVVWVRIAAVILLFVTSGVMIPLYIILLVVMPEAKTVSDRLEMAGEPINLETLKQNATATVKRAEPFLLKIVRAAIGFLLIMGAIAAAAAVAGVIMFLSLHPDALDVFGSNLEAIVSVSLMALGGVMLATFCGVLATIVLRKNTERNLLAALIVTTIVGVVSFGAGIALPISRQINVQNELSTLNVTRRLDVDMAGITAIDLESSDVIVKYSVSDSQYGAVMKYNNLAIKNEPGVWVVRRGNSIVVGGNAKKSPLCQSRFWGCDRESIEVQLTGPAVQAISVREGSLSYQATAQESLSVVTSQDADFTISSKGIINKLSVSATGGSIDASNATISTVSVSGVRSSNYFANIASLEIATQTDSCSSEPVRIHAQHMGKVSVNGQEWDRSNIYPCLTITDGNQM